MSTKEDAKKKAQILKRLREDHKDSVTRTQALLKEQKAIRGQICKAMRDAPKTVPEVAESTGLPADQVLWHITAMRKYDLVAEAGMCGEYYTYQLVQESKK
jgi:predicted Rossmann fold nucleotide-binding protein DprA/Smf involved in DNA uptake